MPRSSTLSTHTSFCSDFNVLRGYTLCVSISASQRNTSSEMRFVQTCIIEIWVLLTQVLIFLRVFCIFALILLHSLTIAFRLNIQLFIYPICFKLTAVGSLTLNFLVLFFPTRSFLTRDFFCCDQLFTAILIFLERSYPDASSNTSVVTITLKMSELSSILCHLPTLMPPHCWCFPSHKLHNRQAIDTKRAEFLPTSALRPVISPYAVFV